MSEPNWKEFQRQRQMYRRAWERGEITPTKLLEVEAEIDEEIAEIIAEPEQD